MGILDELSACSRQRAEADKNTVPIEELKELCGRVKREPHCFAGALKKDGLSFICEIKKASPSKGIISRDFPYLEIAEQYTAAGADCISCLTEPKWFLGSDAIFKEVRSATDVPMIRKDFTVDEYQLYQARAMGADAVLLICAILSPAQVSEYLGICESLGIDAVVEAHNAGEIKIALDAGASIVGVNNRNLKDFSVDVSTAGRLRDMIPPSCVFVAESGMRSAADIAAAKSYGADAVLIGEALMRAPDKAAMLKSLREA